MIARPKRLFLILTVLLMLSAAVSQVMAQAQLAIPILVVNTSFLNVRSGDGPQYTVVATVVGGTELPALGSNRAGTWYLVSTPVGNGWVDVAFTLPRGDFRFVPVVEVQQPAAPAGSTPLSIGLINAQAANTASPQVTATTTTRERAKLQVISVNLRAQPGDNAAVITTMYRDDRAEFPVVGRAFDSRFVEWAALVVPNFGTGWIEAAKLSFFTVQTATTVSTGTGSTTTGSSGIPIPRLNSPIIVVNTSYQNIRTGAGPQFTIITNVPGGTVFYPLGINEDFTWYLVSGDFGMGWISSEFVLFRGDFRNVPILRDLY